MGVRARAGRSAKRHFSSTEWNPGAWAEGQQQRSACTGARGWGRGWRASALEGERRWGRRGGRGVPDAL